MCHGRGNKRAAVALSEGWEGMKRDTAPGTEPVSPSIKYVHNTFNSYSYTDSDSAWKAFGISRIIFFFFKLNIRKLWIYFA